MDDAGKKKKRRSRILSVAGILAGCLVVFAGYWVMQQMLNRRQEVLLSRSGSLQTAEEELTESGLLKAQPERQHLWYLKGTPVYHPDGTWEFH